MAHDFTKNEPDPQYASVAQRLLEHTGSYILAHGEPGDILEFQRDFYTQYGLYLGEGKVMCLDLIGEEATEALVQEHCLEKVCQEGKVCIKNHANVAQEQFGLIAKPPEQIIDYAMIYKDIVVGFEFSYRNSEYYCTMWRYGKGFSTRVAETNFFGKSGYAKYK